MPERRPSLFHRGMSSPPLTVNHLHEQKPPLPTLSTNMGSLLMTPPTSPRSSRSFSNLSEEIEASPKSGDISSLKRQQNGDHRPSMTAPAENTWDGQCPFDIDILPDASGQPQIFGHGAWSTVYRGTAQRKWKVLTGMITPPTSPISTPPVIVAIKKAARVDAKAILEHEARILLHLHDFLGYDRYVIPFYGLCDGSSLVLGALPLSLEDHIHKCAFTARRNPISNSRTEPVIGNTRVWLDLSHRLISALQWLHGEAGVVHGDIKPGNILLSPLHSDQLGFAYEPILIDFSSSQIMDQEPAENTLSAITTHYTAPELLTLAVLRNPKATATPASDVFSLAVTLLAAATGNTLIYPGSSFQRQIMATSGWLVLSNARNDDSGMRIPRHGVVERTLERAVLKANMGRVNIAQWLEIVELQQRGGPTKR